MATGSLVSPGVQVTVTDETTVTTASTGTVPFILVATAENKVNQSNVVAPYTTANTAGQVVLESSQRSLLNDFGTPSFVTVQGTAVNGSEQSEYGLLTAFSSLGISDAAYIMRAPIDLNALSGSVSAPSSNAPTGTLWLDTSTSSWGVFQWNAATQNFSSILPTNASGSGKLWVLTTTDQTTGTTDANLGEYYQPSSTFGKPGDCAVVAVNINNPVWYMNSQSVWTLVGSPAWQSGIPAVVGTVANPAVVTGNLILNGSNVSLTAANVTAVATAITTAAIAGVGSMVTGGRIALTANANATNSAIAIGVGSDSAVMTGLGLTAGTYNAPAFVASPYTQVPHWNATDATPEPTGSVWFNTSAQQNGSNLAVKLYNGTSWVSQSVTVSANDATAQYALDPTGGGINIPAGTIYLETSAHTPDFTTVLLSRVAGPTVLTSANAHPVLANSAYTFSINTTVPGSNTFSGNTTVSFNGPNIANLVVAVNGLGLNGIQAGVANTGAVYFENTNGGTFYLYDGTNTPLSTLGFNLASINNKVSNWVDPTYAVSASAPIAAPANGAIWYYDDPTAVDILINTGTAWQSYRTVTANNEARGYNLTLTDPNGPIVSASVPSAQSNGNALSYGDIWVNTSDLSNLPSIYRYSTGNVWTKIDNTDHTSLNGIIFADARWSDTGNVDPGLGTLTPISKLVNVTPTVLDSDAPSYALYPRGTLLFNTRRSGMNVKKFETNYLTSGTYTDTWVSVSGNDTSGVAYQGSAAQRNMVVESMITALSNSTQILDDAYNFNLMSAPGYPELTSTLIAINKARGEKAFIVTDAPMTLAANANDLNTWANNLNNATTDGVDGLVTHYDYAATYYPAGLTTDTQGNSVVVPAAHMALPAIINSDNISFPWFAPAGARRGAITNATSLGFIDANGNFVVNSIGQGLRDVLYPAGVNAITNFNSNGGIQIYGQKTLSSDTSSELTRINVARLVIYLRNQLEAIARGFVFEQNDSITRQAIAYQIGQFLNSVQSNRGIYDYAVDCSLDNNPPSVVDANELYVSVAVAPTTVAEFIYIPLTLVGSGVLTSSTVTSA